MRQIIPGAIYDDLPCSVVAVGTAMGVKDARDLKQLVSGNLHDDGYLSLDGMNELLRANLEVKRTLYYKRGSRPSLLRFASEHRGQKAVICLLGHFIYYDGENYHSFFDNANDAVVKVWLLK